MALRRAALMAALLMAVPVAARLAAPVTVDIDGCVMPATAKACAKPRDVITMRVGDQKLDFAVEQLSLPTSSVSSAKVLTEFRLRGVTVNGPSELTAQLVKGAHLRLRGVLRTGPRLLLQLVEPRPDT